MRKKELAYLVLILAVPLVLLSGCGTGGGDGGGSSGINTQTDANQVASAIKWEVLDAAPYYSSATWSNSVTSGYISGSVTRNGTFTKTDSYSPEHHTYTYNNVTLALSNYCSDDLYPHLTGNLTINGTASVSSSTGGNTYSGYWEVSGSLTLSAMYASSLTVTMRIYQTGSSHAAIINVGGTEWTVSYP